MPRPRYLSVVIDTFNQAPFIERAVESVLAQDFTGPVEVIVVDDGSTDDTAGLLERFGTHIRVIRQANAGQGAALAAGIRATTRSFVALLDGDDEWRPDHLSHAFAAAEAAQTSCVVWSLTERIDDAGRVLETDPSDAVRDVLARTLPNVGTARAGMVAWFPPTSGIAADGPLLRQVARDLPHSLKIAADGWLQVALTLATPAFAWNLERTVRLRLHAGNAWTGRDDFDVNILGARRALYARLADDVVTLDATTPRRATGLEASLRAQAAEFAIWERIVAGDRLGALRLATSWSPPPWLESEGHRAFRRAQTVLATLTPLAAYRVLRAGWRALT